MPSNYLAVWLRAFRPWKLKVAELTGGRVPQSDADYLAACGVSSQNEAAVHCALAVRTVFAEVGSVDPKFILATDRYPEDLGLLRSWDSTDMLDIVFRLERELGAKISAAPFAKRFTVREFVTTLIHTIGAKR